MTRNDAGFAMVSKFVNLCGNKTFNNPSTGSPFTQLDFMPNTPGHDEPVSLEKAMIDWG